MTAFENYFRTLRTFLPREQREDIIRELSEAMRAQIADKETELCRPLNDEEEAAIIKQYGHPVVTAARYRPQRSLIGPIVFPYYWLALKLFLGLMLAGHAVGAVFVLARDPSASAAASILENTASGVLKVLGWTTVLAAGYDLWLTRSRILERWHPRTTLFALPQTSPPAPDTRPTISGLVVGMVLGAWWLLGLKYPYLFFGSAAADLSWGYAMHRLYPVLVIAQITACAESWVRFASAQPAATLRLSRFVWLVNGVFFIYFVATSDHRWVLWRGEDALVPTIAIVNLALSFVFVLSGVGSILHFVRTLFRVVPRKQAAAA